MKKSFLCVLFCLVLGACTDATGPEEFVPASDPAIADDQARGHGEPELDPDQIREALRDPERRRLVIDALREQHGMEGLGLGLEASERREQMQERRRERSAARETGERQFGARGNWWDDEGISGHLELRSGQRGRIGAAHQELERARRQSRQTMVQGQRQILQAAKDSDREQIESLLTERHAAALAEAEAEQLWLRALLSELSDEQLRVLVEDYPRVLIRR